MVYTLEQVKDAYIKLRSYIYHDTTDLHLRRQLVEFETGITKDPLFDIFGKKNSLYGPAKKNRNISYDEKLEYFTERLNIYHKDDSYFKTLLDQVGINYYPKKIISSKVDPNFITNKKSREPYHISRTTPFINAPIELHIICVLWIMRSGVRLDAQLGDDCLGNRLILNKEKTELVKGSGLFKPYFKQYQKWRDKSIDHAKKLLNDNRDVAFVNLDIKDYFSSIRLSKKEICDPKNKKHEQRGIYNLEQIFLIIHEIHTEQLISKQLLNIDELDYVLDEKSYVVLPIGLVSSYVLANYYLKSFDDSVNRHIKPTYYARYVDDLLFVIADPKHPDDLDDDEFISPNKISDDFTTLEKFVIENFSPVLDIGIKKDLVDDEKKVIQLTEKRYENLYCQSSKSLAYLFDANESHLVIDKLKEELQERTSEFRDFPDEDENKGSFTDAAYHLQYEDSKDKVRTLKDYKEDRFGLTLFLANKIFSSLRQEEELSDTASDSILKFFKNKTAIEFYRLWEKILTLFLVNNKTKHYVAFYLQCIQEIDQLNFKEDLDNIKNEMQKSLAEYLDVANEITFSLNLAFYEKAFQEARDFEFKTQKWKADIFFSIEDYEPTRNDSYWIKRFRKANMIRHHYIIHPLLNFTKGSRNTLIKNLVNPHINFSQFELDEGLVRNSPRRINFWECNMAQIFIELCNEIKISNQENKSEIFTLNRTATKSDSMDEFDDTEDDNNTELDCLLTDSFSLFRNINGNHIPNYEFEKGASASIDNIFKIASTTKKNSPEVWLNEVRVKSDNKQSQFKIAFANTLVEEKNILSSIRGRANLNKDRIKRLGNVIRSARKENADILLFPEFFIPLDLLSSIVDYSKKNQKLVITGLEHIIIGKFAYNFVVTIIPVKIGGVNDAIVIPRLKNHYAHIEKHIIEGNHKMVPTPFMSRYDLIIWKNLYLSNYYCFELANIHHRGLWKNKADLIIGIEWNKDTPYYSNIVEATSRDLHCFFAQVNTSQFGDSRLTKPVQSALKDILRLKGGDNDSLLIATMETKSLREFQRKTFSLTHEDKEFKPLPPDFDIELVLKRINDESVLMS